MTLPNFLVIGTGKAGTTSLHRYLAQHPQVYVSPVKETNFFAMEGQKLAFTGPGDERAKGGSITHLDDYQALFDGVGDETAIGEVSPLYVYSPHAAANIQRHIPKARLIAILRHPAERAFASYIMKVRDGVETLGFEEARQAEAERIAAGWGSMHYVSAGFFYQQLRRYYDRFPPEQLKVFLYEELRERPLEVIAQVFEFLGVDSGFVPDMSTRFNVSGIPRSRTLHRILSGPNIVKRAAATLIPRRLRSSLKTRIKNLNLERQPLTTSTRQELIEIYRDDITQLQDLIGRDLSHWLE